MAHRLAPEARVDLDEIWLYIASHGSPDNADRLIESLTKRFFLLGLHPRAGRRREDLRPGLRTFAVGDYLVIYRVDGADAIVLRVVRGSRELRSLLESPSKRLTND